MYAQPSKNELELRGNYGGLPNGCTLYWRENEAGGRTYYSDEVSPFTLVWDTALICESTLLAAIVQEQKLKFKKYHEENYKLEPKH